MNALEPANESAHEPRLAIAIINHEHWPSVLSQLKAYHEQSAELYDRTEWLIVHNGTTPIEPFERLDPNCPTVVARTRFYCTPNRGYGAAVNEAMQQTKAEHLLVLNADMLPEPGFFEGIHALTAEIATSQSSNRRVGIVGFHLKNPDGSHQGSVGQFPSLGRILLGLFRRRADRKYLRTRLDRLTEGPWTTGACMLLSRQFMTEVGGFDEKYFMYYEDVDLCRRAWQNGWQVLFEPRLALRHFEPYHRRRLTHRMVFVARHGLLRYFWKHRPRWEFRLLGRIVQLECRIRGSADGWKRTRVMAGKMLKDPETVVVTADDLPT